MSKHSNRKSIPKCAFVNIGMAPFVWGPLFWALMNDIAVICDKKWPTLKTSERRQRLKIWKIMGTMLPCKYCRDSFFKFCRQDPPHFPFVKWIFNVHNKANNKLEKPVFEQQKFYRKVQVYHAFSSAQDFWDILFILAYNYEPSKKRTNYIAFFHEMCDIWFDDLISERSYDPQIINVLKSHLDTETRWSQHRISMFEWLTNWFNQTFHTHHESTYFVKKYAPAVAHKTPEELALICGPLLIECQKKSQSRSLNMY